MDISMQMSGAQNTSKELHNKTRYTNETCIQRNKTTQHKDVRNYKKQREDHWYLPRIREITEKLRGKVSYTTDIQSDEEDLQTYKCQTFVKTKDR